LSRGFGIFTGLQGGTDFWQVVAKIHEDAVVGLPPLVDP